MSSQGSKGRTLRFIVKDYGRGIEKKDFKKIFLPFTQTSSETERLYGGTGLGLAISAKIVEALGGTISVDSKVGQWTEMIVDLPSTANNATADMAALSSPLQNCTVVLLGGSAQETSHLEKTLNAYGVAFDSYGGLEEFERVLALRKSRGFQSGRDKNDHLCLINEDIYNPAAFKGLIASNPQRKTTCVTFGPQFRFKETQGHIRSFSRMLPSVLIGTMGKYLKEVPQTPVSPQQVGGGSMVYQDLRVLIAEDNLVNQKVAKRVLNRIGIDKVTIVENGKLAVEEEATGAFDLILMDVQMPVMDGLEACKLIVDRQQEQGAKFPAKVVFCTAHVLDSFKVKCEEAGGAGFLSKPFRLEDVKVSLESLPTPIGQWGLDATESNHSNA